MDNISKFILKNNLISNLAFKIDRNIKKFKLKFVDFKYDDAIEPTLKFNEILEYNNNRKFRVNKNLCFAPKTSMIFSFDGNVYLCCENKSYPIGNITKQTVKEIWFGKKRIELDNSINNNYNLSYGCISCEKKIKNKEYSLALSQTFDLYTNSTESIYPSRLDFEIHNTCNLECVMCGGIYSSSIQANRNNEPAIKNLYGKDFVEQLEEFLPHVKYINLIGGEPTLIKLYYDIMERVIDVNPKCLIHLQTNISTLNDKFKNILLKGNFQIGISIDSLNKVIVERIRKNIDFDIYMKNINFYVDLYTKNKIKLTVNTCPMPENWMDVLDVIDFCNQHKISIFFCIVNAPYFSSFQSATIEFINTVIKTYNNKLLTLPKRNYYEHNNYNRLKDLVLQIEAYQPLIIENEKNRILLMNNEINDLLDIYKNKLFVLMDYRYKNDLIDKIYNYLLPKLNQLKIDEQKDILIIMINSMKESFFVNNLEDSFRWSKEFINTLLFSYKRNIK